MRRVRTDQVRRFALSLPEATEQPHFKMTSFRVRGKIFATAPPDGKHVHIFVDDEQRERAVATEPDAIEDLMWGKRVAGVRVTLARASPALVQELLYQAWSRRAPKRLIASFTATKQNLDA